MTSRRRCCRPARRSTTSTPTACPSTPACPSWWRRGGGSSTPRGGIPSRSRTRSAWRALPRPTPSRRTAATAPSRSAPPGRRGSTRRSSAVGGRLPGVVRRHRGRREPVRRSRAARRRRACRTSAAPRCSTVARPLAKLTRTSTTPSSLVRPRWIRFAHAAQVMPSMAMSERVAVDSVPVPELSAVMRDRSPDSDGGRCTWPGRAPGPVRPTAASPPVRPAAARSGRRCPR